MFFSALNLPESVPENASHEIKIRWCFETFVAYLQYTRAYPAYDGQPGHERSRMTGRLIIDESFPVRTVCMNVCPKTLILDNSLKFTCFTQMYLDAYYAYCSKSNPLCSLNHCSF